MDILMILEGLIANVPEAIALWNKVAPLVAVNASIDPNTVAEIDALTPVAHSAVAVANSVINPSTP